MRLAQNTKHRYPPPPPPLGSPDLSILISTEQVSKATLQEFRARAPRPSSRDPSVPVWSDLSGFGWFPPLATTIAGCQHCLFTRIDGLAGQLPLCCGLSCGDSRVHTWIMPLLYSTSDFHTLNNHLHPDCIDILRETGLLRRPPHKDSGRIFNYNFSTPDS
ncbi:hypothetical protein PAMA_014653 [Pampus argenteus]